jgi:SAM-dependent methyltransferase
MNLLYSAAVKNEVERLKSLGWKDKAKLVDGFLQTNIVDESQISFPSSSYESEPVNDIESGVWAQYRAEKIYDALSSSGVPVLWEVGAGNGNASIPITRLGIPVIGIEPLKSGATGLASQGFTVYCDLLEHLDFPDASIAAIGAFDVLEHLENPQNLLMEIYRVLQPGGIFISTVPANQWMFSDFDLSIGHFRRYSKRTLRLELETVGLEKIKLSYFYFFLMLPAFILRVIPYRLGRSRETSEVESSNRSAYKIIDRISKVIKLILKFESIFGPPIGLSLLGYAEKPKYKSPNHVD